MFDMSGTLGERLRKLRLLTLAGGHVNLMFTGCHLQTPPIRILTLTIPCNYKCERFRFSMLTDNNAALPCTESIDTPRYASMRNYLSE